MRDLILAAATVAAFAAQAPSVAAADTTDEWCTRWQDFAKMTMWNRQNGLPVTAAVKTIAEVAASGAPDGDVAVAEMIVKAAYGEPLAETDRLAEVASIEFAERYFAICMEAAGH